jgi:glyoxylase-like metal-dependent hydrolase (beta-lactamase superfamily II)
MKIEIKRATLGLASTNAYLVADADSGDAALIDPVDDAPFLAQMAAESGWTIRLILATHAHFDHILASKELKALTNAPFIIHQDAVPMLKALPDQAKRFGLPTFPEAAAPDRLLTNERETIELGALKFETIYTPGHAPGHVAFYLPDLKVAFCGDALFYDGIGRTDLPGGSLDVLLDSILNHLFPLGDDVTALPGHGQQTTLGRERRFNPWLQPDS